MPSSPTPSSSTPPRWTYDVFLSFRGKDTRRGLSSHIYTTLRESGILIFMADEMIERGAYISGSLRRAIERSRMSLVVFSKNYASSRWCLDEVVKIMECQRSQGQVVIPIFDGVDPSDVRHQRGTFGESMKQQERKFGKRSDQVLRWREALTAAANIAGFSTSAYRGHALHSTKAVQTSGTFRISGPPLNGDDNPTWTPFATHNSSFDDYYKSGTILCKFFDLRCLQPFESTLAHRHVYPHISEGGGHA